MGSTHEPCLHGVRCHASRRGRPARHPRFRCSHARRCHRHRDHGDGVSRRRGRGVGAGERERWMSDLGLITVEMLGGALTDEPASGTALSPRTGKAIDLPDTERPAYARGGLLASNTPTGVAVRDAAADGAPLLWKSEPEAPPGTSGPARVAADSTIPAGDVLVLEWPTADGVQFTVHRFDDGTLLATLPGAPAARTLSTPAEDTVFFTTDTPTRRTVIAVSPSLGELWQQEVPSASQPVSATTDSVWFTASSGYISRDVDAAAFVDDPAPRPHSRCARVPFSWRRRRRPSSRLHRHLDTHTPGGMLG